MQDNTFSFCPQCGSRNIQTLGGGRKWVCPDCALELFNNVASAVGLIICDGQGRVLFERRAKEPRKGYLALPGGFTECDESAEQSAVRECLEETGVAPVSLRYVCTFPNTYEYKGITYKTCDMFFAAELPPDYTLRAQESEVSSFEWVPVTSAEQADGVPVAFPSARNALHAWLEER